MCSGVSEGWWIGVHEAKRLPKSALQSLKRSLRGKWKDLKRRVVGRCQMRG